MNNETLARIRESIDEAAFDGARALGRRLSPETALEVAIAALNEAEVRLRGS